MGTANTEGATYADQTKTPIGAGRRRMKQSFLGATAFAAALAVGLWAEAPAQAAAFDAQGAVLTQSAFVPYVFGGRQFCWYDSAWSGPGWYWCGYAWRNGFGWGGPRGWNGWRRAGHYGGYGHGGFAGGHGGDGGAHFGGGHMGGAGHMGGGGGHMGGGGGGGHR